MADITKRMNYFDRQFLRAKDFQDEQDYHIDRRRRHNRLLHTPGVAEGLEVTGKTGTNIVTVSKGTAINPKGQEIVLDDQRTVHMPTVSMSEDETCTVEIYIAYSEDKTDPSSDPGVAGETRTTESHIFPLRLIRDESVDPVPPDGVLLADATLTNNGYLNTNPDNTVRVRMGIVLDDLTIRSLTLKRGGVASGEWPELTCSQANQAALEGDLNVTGTLTGQLGSNMVGTDQIVNNNVTMNKLAAPVRSAINAPIVSVDGVSNPGGNIDLIPANTITIAPDDANDRITIGENHSARTNNPHGTTAAHVKALSLNGGTLSGDLQVNDSVRIGVSGTGTGWKIGINSSASGSGPKRAGSFSANSGEGEDRTNALSAYANSSGDGQVNGLSVRAYGTGTGGKFGIDSNVSGSGQKCAGNFSATSGEGEDYTNALYAYASSSGNGPAYGLMGYAVGDGKGPKYGVYGSAGGKEGTKYAGYFQGNVHVQGALSKTSGSFLIDHPLDPYNKTLRHSFVESPEDLCLYRGKAKLDSKGRATVKMPEYFPILTKEEEATVTLTPVGKKPFLLSFEWASKFTAFTIFGTPNAEATYIVLADRDDPSIHHFRRPVEEDKGDGNFEKGKLLCPEAYSRPREMGVGYFEEEYRPPEIEPQQIIEEHEKIMEEQKQREEEHRKVMEKLREMEESHRQKGGQPSGK